MAKQMLQDEIVKQRFENVFLIVHEFVVRRRLLRCS